MRDRWVGNIGDFCKLALLRHLMTGRRLAICWYVTGRQNESAHQGKYFGYLHRPGEFRHLAPEIFDALKELMGDSRTEPRRINALEASGLLDEAVFHGREVPKRASLRKIWASELVESIGEANLVFLDPDNGIQGKRLTPKHVALSEIAALRRHDRTLVLVQRQSGRQSEARFLAERMQSLGCHPIELIRFRLVSSRFYVVADHDDAMSERIASFARRWGDWVKTYEF
jgi:hypothetical protein